MRKESLAVLTAALLFAAAIVAGLLLDRGGDSAAPLARADEAAVGPAGGSELSAAGPEGPRAAIGRDPEPVPEVAAPVALVAYPAERPLAELVLEVVDAEERPVQGAVLELRSDIGSFPPGLEIADDRGIALRRETDGEGRARFEALPVGPYTVDAALEGTRARKSLTLFEHLREAVRVVLDPRREQAEVTVRVEDEGGAPVAGADVEVFARIPGVGLAGAGGLPPLRAATADDGIAVFPDAAVSSALVLATAPDGRKGLARPTFGDRFRPHRPEAVTVAESGTLEGSLTGLPPGRLGHARVQAHALTSQSPYYWTHGITWSCEVHEGRFRFGSLAAGTYGLTLEDPDGARLVLPRYEYGGVLENSVVPATAEVHPRETTIRDLEVTLGEAIEGQVVGPSGTGIAGARVWSTYAPATSNFPAGFTLHGVNVWRMDADSRTHRLHPEIERRTCTDATGHYSFPGLQPGRHRIEVFAPALTYDRREGVEVSDGETTRLVHVLEAAGVIQGVDRQGGYLGLTRSGEEAPRFLAIIRDDGQFTFPALEPGAWEVARFHSDASRGKVPLTTVQVRPGRTTWVDLTDVELPVRLEGRVLDAAGPVAGALVSLYRERLETDEEGRFATTVAWPYDRLRPRVETLDGISTAFQFPGMGETDTLWSEDLVLGAESLTVRTLDAEGTPAPAELELRLVDPSPPYGWLTASVRAGAGFDTTIGHLLPGTYRVLARFEDGGELTEYVDVPRTGFAVLRARPTGTVVVEVRTPAGLPVDAARVFATTWLGSTPAPEDFDDLELENERLFEESFARRGAKTDPDGRVELTGVTAGALQIEVWPPDGWKRAERTRLTLDRGETRELVFELLLD